MFTNLLSLASFNEILALSVGLNLAYIMVNKSQLKITDYSLFSFLDSLARQLAKKAFNDKTIEQQKFRSLVTRIQYYISTGQLSPESTAVLKHISDMAQNVLNEIDSTEKEIQQRFSEANCIKTSYMPHLAFDCAVYGFILLLLAAFENDLCLSFYNFISVFNGGIVLLSLYCVYHENKNHKDGEGPTVINQVVILSVICILGCIYPNKWEILSGVFWANLTVLLAVFFSMSSLIAYFINCSLKCIKEFFLSKQMLKGKSRLSEAIIREREIDSFKEEFDSIDAILGKPDFELNIESVAETS